MPWECHERPGLFHLSFLSFETSWCSAPHILNILKVEISWNGLFTHQTWLQSDLSFIFIPWNSAKTCHPSQSSNTNPVTIYRIYRPKRRPSDTLDELRSLRRIVVFRKGSVFVDDLQSTEPPSLSINQGRSRVEVRKRKLYCHYRWIKLSQSLKVFLIGQTVKTLSVHWFAGFHRFTFRQPRDLPRAIPTVLQCL